MTDPTLIMIDISAHNTAAAQNIIDLFNVAQQKIISLFSVGDIAGAKAEVFRISTEVSSISQTLYPDNHTIEADAVTHWCTVAGGVLELYAKPQTS